MAYEVPVAFNGTLKAGVDLSGSQYLFVLQQADDGDVDLAAENGPATGVLQNNPTLGKPCVIMTRGVSKVRAKGTPAAGASIGVGSTSGAKTWASGSVVGRLVDQVAATDGALCSVELIVS